MREWVFLFPGQGSQYVGMGRDFYENYAEVRELFSIAGDLLEMDVAKLCFEGPEEMLVLTENVQPAITVVNLACLTVLHLHEIYPAAAAGHSLGEYSALYAAGVLGLRDVLKLVRWRGKLMHEASLQEPGSMAAIIDLTPDKVREICVACDVEVANINCPDQIVITGPHELVERAIALGTEVGAQKCIKLNVSGPWHSRCMAYARERFEPVVRECTFREPQIPILHNVDSLPLQAAKDAPERLIEQICRPVLWKQSMERLVSFGRRNFVEVGPKKVLRGLMRRIDRTVKVLNVEDSASLASFLQANQ
ncbi:MAG TPA: ACP S-malonyltransferase [Syntrophobacteraceae bacterium]|nr:ACP S-malonyltransferase [Syntrophobacteraceae bacterium]